METGNNVAPFDLVDGNNEVWEILSPSIGLSVYLVRTGTKMNEVIIEFTVHGAYQKTGTGNAFQIFSTVEAILQKYLKGYIQSSDRTIAFGAEKAEPSRMKLYNRMVPKMNSLLGPGWVYGSPNVDGSQKKYIWTRKQ